MSKVPDELIQKARDELNETPERRKEGIKVISDRLLNQGVSENFIRSDPDFLLRFLRVSKFDYDKTLNRLNEYFASRKKFKYLFPENILDISDAIKAWYLSVLPKRDKDGCCIIYYNLGRWDPEKYSFQDIMQTFIATVERVIELPEVQICGAKFICDCAGFGLRHVLRMSPTMMIRCLQIIQSILPLRMKGLYAVNQPAVFSITYYILRPFMTTKFQQRFHFYGSDLTKLHETLGVENLPEELGGQLPAAKILSEAHRKDMLEWDQSWVKYCNYSLTTKE